MSSCSRSGIWCTGVAVMTSRPKNAEQREQDDGDDARRRRRSAACRRPSRAARRSRARRSAGRPACRRPGRCRGPTAIMRQPADDQPAARLGARRPAQQPQRGEEQDDGQHHDQRADDPADGRRRAPAPTGPMPLLHAAAPEHDRQAEHGQADAVAAVLGRERLGLLRAGDRAGEAAGAAGEQVPAAAATTPNRPGESSSWRRAGGRGGALGGRPLLARSRRTGAAPGGRRPSRRRGAGRHASDGNRRGRPDPAGGRSCPAPDARGPNVTDMTSVSPTGSWPTPITSELVVRAAARLGEVVRRRRRRLVVGVPARRGRPVGDRPALARRHRRPTSCRRRGTPAPACTSTAAARGRCRTARCGSPSSPTSGCTGWTPGSDAPVAVTPEPAVPAGVRHADLRVLPDGAARRPGDPPPTGDRRRRGQRDRPGVAPTAHEVLVSGPDFVSDPRLAPDGVTLSWLQWDHPNMPWDAAQLVVRAADGTEHVLAGGPGRVRRPAGLGRGPGAVVVQRPDRRLVAVPEAAARGGRARRRRRQRHRRPAVGVRAEPVRAARRRPGRVRLRPRRRRPARRPRGRRRACASSTCPSAPFRYVTAQGDGGRLRRRRPGAASRSSCGSTSTAGEPEVLRPARDLGLDPAWFSRPEHVTFPTEDRGTGIADAHALVYPPTNPEVDRARTASCRR